MTQARQPSSATYWGSPRDSVFLVLPGVLEMKVMSPRPLPSFSARIASRAIRWASNSELVFPFLIRSSASSGNSTSKTRRRPLKLGPTENSTRVNDGTRWGRYSNDWWGAKILGVSWLRDVYPSGDLPHRVRWAIARKLFDVRLLRAKSANPPMPTFRKRTRNGVRVCSVVPKHLAICTLSAPHFLATLGSVKPVVS